jgi:TolB-like protein/class 3 adenylate cyclase/tetratricopeptide (TPR) repeat protein
MANLRTSDHELLERIYKIIDDNIANDQFGVSELADAIGMSRSNLLRKVRSLTESSVSQLIRRVRLAAAVEKLESTSLTISEIAFDCGFSSVSYFIKCFREEYGYPPGEYGKEPTSNDNGSTADINPPYHQLAAIMFTDIEGYTATMQQNEQHAINLRKRHREVVELATQKYQGKILQYYGDGSLGTFRSAIDAVKCAIEMQLAFRQAPEVPVRIGLHTGDIVYSEEGIIGDGVNISSRIESLAVPGSVLISEKVYDEIKNQPAITTQSLGTFELKNVGKPMEVWAIANPGLQIPEEATLVERKESKKTTIGQENKSPSLSRIVKWAVLLLLLFALGYATWEIILSNHLENQQTAVLPGDQNKSIAVLPLINDSNDSSNVYFVNGLMESVLYNLQKIEDLRVVSRNSVEKYRNNPVSTAQIASELKVGYFVEGSGQKVGDEIMLNIQLIDVSGDRHIWSKQYVRQVDDIFSLQQEVAKSIAGEIEVLITPEEVQQINKVPTDNLIAYDHFLKGVEYYHMRNMEGLIKGIEWFEKAIQEDPEFSVAYANIAIGYYYLDIYRSEKKYAEKINHYADKALLYDDKSSFSLLAKGYYYLNSDQYSMAESYLVKALQFNPNSTEIINALSDFYANYMPDTEKYLKYALKGIRLDIASSDSITASFTYLHVSNALIQTGFVNEALIYVDHSLAYNPENLYSQYVKAYIELAKNGDLEQTKNKLLVVYQKDPSRLDVIQEVGKLYYYLRDYDSAYYYYRKFLDIKNSLKLDVYPGEDGKIAVVMDKTGHKEEARKLMAQYKYYAERDNSIYRNLSLGCFYAYQGDKQKSLERLREFSGEDHFQYWLILFLNDDPMIDKIKDMREYDRIFNALEKKFWQHNQNVATTLKAEGLI